MCERIRVWSKQFVTALAFPSDAIVSVAILLLVVVNAGAQNRTLGEIRGTVTDQSEARIGGGTVELTNRDTGVTTRVVTNSQGVYDAPSLVPGFYNVKITAPGFKSFLMNDVEVRAEGITVNGTLQVGNVSEQITVQATTAQVQSDSAEVRTDLDAQMTTELPNVGKSEFNLYSLLPGIQPQGAAAGTGGSLQGGIGVAAINGQQGGEQNFTIDGGTRTVNTGQGVWNAIVPIDAIATENYMLSNFGAQYGSGLTVFNATTKSGTNNWHGSLYEFVQNDFFNARNYFVPKTATRWNLYGGSVGGPIKRDKAFFFFAFQSNPIVSFQPNYFTFPTAAMRAGDFSQVPGLDASGNSTGQPIPLFDPASLYCDPVTNACTRTQPLPGNKIPSNRISPMSAAYEKFFPLPTFNNPNEAGQSPAACNAPTGVLPQNCFVLNTYFSGRNPTTNRTYNAKVDHDINAHNRLEASTMINDQKPIYGFNPGAPANGQLQLPAKQYTGQISDFWTASSSLVNEARFAINRVDGHYTPKDAGVNPNKNLIGLTGSLSSMLVGVSWNGQFGSGFNNAWPEFDSHVVDSSYVPSDIITWVKGKHILKIGGEYDALQQNNFWNNPDSITFSGSATENPAAVNANPYNQGLGYADFLLGEVNSSYSTVSPLIYQRMKAEHVFVQDDYKIRKNLTLNIGFRYEHSTAWSEKYGREGSFSPTAKNYGLGFNNVPLNGKLGSMVFGSAAVPNDYNLYDPRVGFSYSPRDKWAIRGGYGIYHVQLNLNTYGGNGTLGNGWAYQNTGYTQNPVVPAYNWDTSYPAYTVPTRTPDVYNTQSVNYVPKRLPASYSHQWTIGVQHELPARFFLDVKYVATRGVHLSFNRDVNQVPENQLYHFTDPSVNMIPYRPYNQYQGIYGNLADGFSFYNALQISLKKQYRGLDLLANYTQSKTHDTGTSTINWTTPEVYQNAYDVKANYKMSAQDVPYVVNGGVVYELPVGRGKPFLNQGGIVNAVVGGWKVSSVWSVVSGTTFTPQMAYNYSGALSGNWFPVIVGDANKPGNVANNPGCIGPTKVHTLSNWFNPCAYVAPAMGTFGDNGARNSLRGPAWRNVDLGVTKKWMIPELNQGYFELKLEATDAFNHPNFTVPNASIGGGSAGLISTAQTSRVLQIGARVAF
jgi:hypothetical protein